jgi:hypothetical protein
MTLFLKPIRTGEVAMKTWWILGIIAVLCITSFALISACGDDDDDDDSSDNEALCARIGGCELDKALELDSMSECKDFLDGQSDLVTECAEEATDCTALAFCFGTDPGGNTGDPANCPDWFIDSIKAGCTGDATVEGFFDTKDECSEACGSNSDLYVSDGGGIPDCTGLCVCCEQDDYDDDDDSYYYDDDDDTIYNDDDDDTWKKEKP